MKKEGKEYLSELVNAIICNPNAFKIRLEEGGYIFSVLSKDQKISDWYAVSAIYDSICEVDRRIKFAFNQAISFDISETLDAHKPFSKLTKDENISLYHTENIVFRVSILWDLLAQLCNVIFETNLEVDKINYSRYFEKYSKGENSIEIIRVIKAYIDQTEDSVSQHDFWVGNHAFLKDYRNQMTHRVSPNITSISSLGITLRPPAMYVLHRTIEDYYMVSYFLCDLINKFLEEHNDWIPMGIAEEDKDNS